MTILDFAIRYGLISIIIQYNTLILELECVLIIFIFNGIILFMYPLDMFKTINLRIKFLI